jgi:hypothetical protein
MRICPPSLDALQAAKQSVASPVSNNAASEARAHDGCSADRLASDVESDARKNRQRKIPARLTSPGKLDGK